MSATPRPPQIPAGSVRVGHDADGSAVLDKSDLLSCFGDIGVRRGGTLLVHSSLSSFGTVRGGEHTVIDALLETIGPNGLLVMPTHTWSTVSAALGGSITGLGLAGPAGWDHR